MAADPDAPFGRKARTGEPRKGPAQGGRPSLLNEAAIKDLVTALSMFAPVETACKFAGINKSTFYRWLEIGAKHRRARRVSKFSRFKDSIEKAMAAAEIGCVGVILQAAQGKSAVVKSGPKGKVIVVEPARAPQWQAAAWLAERRNPREFARRTYRLEEERGPVAAQGSVVPYEVALPAIDALLAPSAGVGFAAGVSSDPEAKDDDR
jgi:hypothetical protein